MKFTFKAGVIAAFLAAAALASTASAQQVQGRLAHFAAINSPIDQASQEFVKLVGERTNNRISIALFPNSQLGGVEATARDMSRGALDMALLSPGSLAGLDPHLDIHFLPFIATNFKQVDAIFYNPQGTLQKTLREALARKNIQTLAFFELEFRALTNSMRPVEKPADLKGMKLRVPSSAAIKDFFEAAGAQAVAMPFPELFPALQQKTVDGQDNGATITYESRLYETQKYMTVLQHVYAMGTFNASSQFWAKLTEADRKLLTDIAVEVSKRQIVKNRELGDQYLKKLEQAGIKVSYPSEAAYREFSKLGQTIWDKLTPTYGAERIRALREEVKNAQALK